MRQDNRKSKVRIGEDQLVEFGLRKRKISIDRSIFRKTPEEKIKAREITLKHKRKIKQAGLNPKKVMNLPEKRA